MDIKKLMLGAVVGAGALVAMSGSASAYVVCNRDGDCWRARDRYDYQPAWGLTVRDDNWRWRQHERYRWRHHDGRGYWRSGVWVTF